MKKMNVITLATTVIFFVAITLWNWFGTKMEYSETERRMLAKRPEFTIESLVSGEFSKEFEAYVVDTFQVRDMWRRIKAYVRTGIFTQKDNHGIYSADGHIAKIEYPMNEEMLDYAIETFSQVNKSYLEGNNVYFAIVPDKNRYVAEKEGHLSMDYNALTEYMKAGMDFAEYIEIADLLESEDYYYTDSHWRQEKILNVAERIASSMGVQLSRKYEEHQVDTPFYGVYMGQSALVHEPDTLKYLTNEVLESATVDVADGIYDMKKAQGRDPYEMFLSGNQSVVTVRNEKNTSGKRLIIFRDSFGSSIAPLFLEAYTEIVLVDLRYIPSAYLGEFVDFKGADVLFLYSTLLLNNSLSLR